MEDFNNKVAEIYYTNTIPETVKAFGAFQKKYMMRRTLLFSLVYLIAAALGVNLIITSGGTNMIGYFLTALCLALIAIQWARPYQVRKKLVTTLSDTNEETYHASFFGNRIEIETEIIPETEKTERVAVTAVGVMTVDDNSEAARELAEKEAKGEPTGEEKPATTIIDVAKDELKSVEDEEMFMLFWNRSLIYIFPKRCMSEEEAGKIRDYFADKNI